MAANKLQWKRIAKGDELPCQSFLRKKNGEILKLSTGAGVTVGQDAYYLPVDEVIEEIKNYPIEESEDERIRKWCISHFKECINVVKDNDEYKEYLNNKVIPWLEKQGEHADFRNKIQIGDKVTRNEDGMLVNLSQLKRVAKKDEQIFANSAKTCKDEQKPAWSEKDEAMTEIIINDIVAIKERTYCKNVCDEEINWLESLKDRVQPKQEWSEEDESRVTTICTYLQDYARLSGSESRTIRINEYCDWLKSLRPQNRWKPSEKQMEALTAISSKEILSGYERGMLVGLYTDLLKLKEE